MDLKKMKKGDLILQLEACFLTSNERQRKVKELEAENAQLRRRHVVAMDAAQYFAERCPDAKPEEIAQLGIGTFIPAEKNAAGEIIKPASVQFLTLDDLGSMTNAAMNEQSTVAKFRQLKQHFQTHQRAVTALLDRLDALGRKNYISTEDLRRFGELRSDLSYLTGRKI